MSLVAEMMIGGVETELGVDWGWLRCRLERSDLPRLVRLHLRLPAIDPWIFLDEWAWGEERITAWHDPETGLCFAAKGGLRPGEELQHHPIRALSPISSRQIEQPLELPSAPGKPVPRRVPLAVVAFSFDDRPSLAGTIWAGWPDAMFEIPRLTIHQARNGAPCWATFTGSISAPDTIDSHLRFFQAQVHEVENKIRAGATSQSDRSFIASLHSVELHESKPDFCRRVERAKDAIDSSVLEKVVLARAITWRAPEGRTFDPLASVRQARALHPRSTAFAFSRPGAGTFLGATPERLVQVRDRRLATHAVAGTARRHEDPRLDRHWGDSLLASEKDRHEHQFVVRAIEGALAPFCAELHVALQPRLLRLPHLQHLETPIHGRLLPQWHILDLVEALHPTPAVGGVPVEGACRWLQVHEPLNRGWYAAPIGWLDGEGGGSFVVGLRSALLRGSRATAFAGAGIVRASDPASEWRETGLKLKTMQKTLRLTGGPR